MKKKFIVSGLVIGLSMPAIAFAEGLLTGSLDEVVARLGELIDKLIPITFAVLVFSFFVGLIRFLFAVIFGGDEGRKSAQGIMIFGVIALFLAASVWGIVDLMQQALGIEPTEVINIPTVDTEV